MNATEGKGRIVIAGGTGLLGRRLAAELERRGHPVAVLTRRAASRRGPGRAVRWDGRSLAGGWADELEGAAALVNLAGPVPAAGAPRRRREAALRSLVEPVHALGEALRTLYRPPQVWVQASGLEIYGDAGDRICDECAFVPGGWPSEACIAREEALGLAVRPEMRWTALRIGLVLGRGGGALPGLARLARFGIDARRGSDRRWISWIHEEDMTRILLEAIANPALEGVVNAAGLQPVTEAEFHAALRRAAGPALGLAAPAWLGRLCTALPGLAPGTVPGGRRCLPVRIHGLGFRFRHHELEPALASLLLPEPEAGRGFGRLQTNRSA